MALQNHFMQKGDAPIIKVELNEWAKHRQSGFEFRTELEYQNQQAALGPTEETPEKKPAKKKMRRR